ncbi:unnamed protein product [Bursaphelenchus okinawaensis]|uniref:DNA polymerase II subunit 2 n=1 Tax=Bursaphelenchus okinawaensis TaxID=465554 RepID=A0A811KSL1_9BILA|nr:unnamed protein product [Bursaphelenchus okinawaensis]CAG9111429.1 unnamed protein product [Bursaphelenchus okinawaensis]
MSDPGRAQIRRCFEQAMISIRTDALNQLTSYCKEMDHGSRRKYISNLIEKICISGVDDLNLETLKDLLVAKKTQIRSGKEFEVFESPNWPNYEYDKASKAIVPKERQDLLANDLVINSFVKDRVKYIFKNLADSQGFDDLESLLCLKAKKTKVLLVILRDLMDRMYGQDATGQVVLEVTEKTTFEENAYFFYGGIFVCEGDYRDGILTIKKLTLPVLKPLNEMPSIVPTDVLNRQPFDAPKNSDCIVILSDVFLDRPEVHEALNQLFMGYSEAPPAMFILCGSFRSIYFDYSLFRDVEKDFKQLEELITRYNDVYKNTQFVLIPGPRDPPCGDRLPSIFMETIKPIFENRPNVNLVANPSKVLFKNKVIQAIRDDVIEKLAGETFHISENSEIGGSYSRTIWSQRNAFPLHPKGSPINYGNVYDFIVMPDLLILADDFTAYRWKPSEDQENQQYKIVNPGRFAQEPFKFMIYYPKDGRTELNSIH